MSIFPPKNYSFKSVGDDCALWCWCMSWSLLEECYLFLFCLILFTVVPQDQEEEGVSRVRVTSRRSPHKVERVSGLVARSHVDMPKVSEAKQKGEFPRGLLNTSSPHWLRHQRRQQLQIEADTNDCDDVMMMHFPWQFSEVQQKHHKTFVSLHKGWWPLEHFIHESQAVSVIQELISDNFFDQFESMESPHSGLLIMCVDYCDVNISGL